MNKDQVELAKKTLKLLESKKWESISLPQILNKQKKIKINNKDELLTLINRYFDYLLKKNLSYIEISSKKDMLFEVIMARLDILNIHRLSIKNLIKYFLSNPQKFLKLLPSFVETIILISTISNININGIKGTIKIKSIFILYLLSIYTWQNDESKSLEKTMTNLDNHLNNFQKIINL